MRERDHIVMLIRLKATKCRTLEEDSAKRHDYIGAWQARERHHALLEMALQIETIDWRAVP